MANVFLDGAPVEMPETVDNTVGDVIGEISKKIDKSRRVIGVTLDGVEITGQPDQHLAQLGEDGRLELTTGLASVLAMNTLESIEEFHTALLTELSRTADEFRMGTFERANELFARCMDGLQILLNTTLSVATLLDTEPGRVNAGEGSLEENTQKMGQILDEMIGAQTNRDGILLADLIEYELQPLLEDWLKAISNLRALGAEA